jgi:nucleoside-diphosphate-sugar epimerase
MAVDTGFYRSGWLYPGTALTPLTLNKDIRQITLEDLEGMDAVVHMAELSNDPTGELAPEMTYEINHLGSVRLAQLAKRAGISRFVYMSSCSVYGIAGQSEVDEESPLNPQTAYAKCKTLVERDLKLMADESFSPVFMRNATAYGASPRMRFDIVLNNLAGLAWTTREIKMSSDGTPWRPVVHALDIAQAIVCALEAPREVIHNQVFNVGDSEQNYRIKELAQIIAEVFPGCHVTFGQNGSDNRSYRVSFAKVKAILPGFSCRWNPRRGAEQLRDVFAQVGLTEADFGHRAFTRLKQLEHLIATRQIDEKFFWRVPPLGQN